MAENQVTVETDNLLSSPAAFVEGGIQDPCDDACSICLDEFSDSDPSTVTCCKHEFHLQCILEWCQRSSQCPMCWQPISLKDPTSQELLEAVEREREIRSNPPRHMAIFHHPTLGDFELQHLPVGGNDGALEERIIQHLAAAAAMGRTHHHGRREGHRRRPSSQSRPHLLVFSSHHPHAGTVPAAPVAMVGGTNPAESEAVAAAGAGASPSIPFTSSSTTRVEPSRPRSVQTDEIMSSSLSGPSLFPASRQGFSFNNNRISVGHPSSPIQDRAGPSDLQSFSESLKSKWNSVSMRYKESISKSSRGWREKLFARNCATGDVSPEAARREEVEVNVNAGRVEGERNGENQGKNPLVDGNGNPSGSLSN